MNNPYQPQSTTILLGRLKTATGLALDGVKIELLARSQINDPKSTILSFESMSHAELLNEKENGKTEEIRWVANHAVNKRRTVSSGRGTGLLALA